MQASLGNEPGIHQKWIYFEMYSPKRKVQGEYLSYVTLGKEIINANNKRKKNPTL